MKAIRMLFVLMLAASSLAILKSTPVHADTPTNSEVSQAAPPQTAPPQSLRRAESNVSFTGLTLKGRLKKPDLGYIYRRRGLRAEQIVNIPEEFNEEIVQGAGKF